jgi:predicted ferric reductase
MASKTARRPTRFPTGRASPRAANPRHIWLLLVLAFVVAPVVLGGFGGWHQDRSVVAELGSTLGIVALGVLALELVLTARLRLLRALGADVSVRLHRRLANVLVSLVVAHVALSIAGDPTRMALLEFFGQPWRAQVAAGSVVALALIGLTSRARAWLGLGYPAWRLMHVTLAIAALVLATVHTIGWHRYLMHGSGRVALVAIVGAALASAATLRLRHPLALGRALYVVDRLVPEQGGATTVELRASGHDGQPFRPGQFAWVKLASSPLGLAEHPFSYSSSAADPARPSFTIRAYDGFSARVPELRPGTPVLVDGPHGAFALREGGRGIVLIAAGIGITPCMSILRTAADRFDQRPVVLIYGSRDERAITFEQELAALSEQLPLQVVHVISRPTSSWNGERGRIDAGVLERHLPADLRGWQFFSCGSGPAVDAALLALTHLGVPAETVHAERFVAV